MAFNQRFLFKDAIFVKNNMYRRPLNVHVITINPLKLKIPHEKKLTQPISKKYLHLYIECNINLI